MKETTQEIGDAFKESKPDKSPHLAVENTQSQSPMGNGQDDTKPGILYDVSLENTLTNMKKNEKCFFKIEEDQNRQTFWKGIPVEMSGDSRVETEGKNFNLTPNLQKVFTDTTGKSSKKLDKMENLTYKKLLKTLSYENYKPKSGEIISDRYKHTENILKPINLQGHGIEKKYHTLKHN